MVNPRTLKLQLKDTIISVLKRDGEAKIEVLKSSLMLETGFTEKVLSEILKNMLTVGFIEDKEGVLTLTDKGKAVGVEK